jgi:hypothetical protein
MGEALEMRVQETAKPSPNPLPVEGKRVKTNTALGLEFRYGHII